MSDQAEAVSRAIHSTASEAPLAAPATKSMSIIVTKDSLDRTYPPFLLATTAA